MLLRVIIANQITYSMLKLNLSPEAYTPPLAQRTSSYLSTAFQKIGLNFLAIKTFFSSDPALFKLFFVMLILAEKTRTNEKAQQQTTRREQKRLFHKSSK